MAVSSLDVAFHHRTRAVMAIVEHLTWESDGSADQSVPYNLVKANGTRMMDNSRHFDPAERTSLGRVMRTWQAAVAVKSFSALVSPGLRSLNRSEMTNYMKSAGGTCS